MTKRMVMILAAGEAARMHGVHKQLLRLGPETILDRIVRQCKRRGSYPTVVTHRADIAGEYWDLNPDHRRWTVETLLSSTHIWTTRNIVLLGDVVYSRDLMDRIFRFDGAIRVWGHKYEIFGISFLGSLCSRVVLALQAAIEYAEQTGTGKLRTFYQAYCGLEMGGNAIEALSDDSVFDYVCFVKDYTADVDTPDDWQGMLRKIKAGRLKDE